MLKPLYIIKLIELWGINGDESRTRINAIHRQRATENLKKLDEFVTAYMSIKNKKSRIKNTKICPAGIFLIKSILPYLNF